LPRAAFSFFGGNRRIGLIKREGYDSAVVSCERGVVMGVGFISGFAVNSFFENER